MQITVNDAFDNVHIVIHHYIAKTTMNKSILFRPYVQFVTLYTSFG